MNLKVIYGIKQIDQKLFHGKIRDAYYSRKIKPLLFREKRPVDDVFQKSGERCVRLTVKTADLLLCQYNAGRFDAYDTVVRLLAVENYYQKNDCGFALYQKMQKARGSYESHNESRFWELIKSVEANGYAKDSLIETDRNMILYDGSHRLALALYHEIDSVDVRMVRDAFGDRSYGLDWFWKNSFTREEIEIIINRCKEVIEECTPDFYAIFWPAMNDYMDEVYKDLEQLSEQMRFLWKPLKSLSFDPLGLSLFIDGVYSSDDTAQESIDKMKKHMIGGATCEVHLIQIRFDCPDYRINAPTGLPLSTNGEKLKEIICSRYMSRIDDYYFDNICHIPYNRYQVDCVKRVIAST